MSTEITKDIVCPQCGESQKYRLYAGINAQRPERSSASWTRPSSTGAASGATTSPPWPTPSCTRPPGQVRGVRHPGGEQKHRQPNPRGQGLYQAPGEKLAELKEKILILDGGYDDVAVELVKNALCSIVKNSYKVNRVHAYFSRVNQEEMEFAIFLPRKAEPVYHSTKLDVYKQSQEVLRALDFVDPEGFLTVDAKLARQIIEDYQDI